MRREPYSVDFPLIRLVVVFSLAVGTMLDAALGRFQGKGGAEIPLFRTLDDVLEPGDVVALQTVNAFLPHLRSAETPQDADAWGDIMIVSIGWKRVPDRPNRREPGAVKRRGNKFPKLGSRASGSAPTPPREQQRKSKTGWQK